MPVEWNPAEISRPDEFEDEPLGTKDKFWLQLAPDGHDWLFKYARERDGAVRGEDWAEWVTHHVAGLLHLPTATVRPAECEGKRGVISRSVVNGERGERLEHGNSRLAAVVAEYDATLQRENPHYTILNVQMALRGVQAPREFSGPSGFTGFDVWAGYLMLDALVAGRDRHHENWAILDNGDEQRLAPSYDHGNGLGFQESDEHRTALLENPDRLQRWVARGRSHHFAGRPPLIDLAHEALERAQNTARNHWFDRLMSMREDDVQEILDAVPRERMSVVARRFAFEIVLLNRERLRDGYPHH